MEASRTTVCASIDIALAPAVAFDVLIEELAGALVRGEMSFEAEPNGRVVQSEFELGRAVPARPERLMRTRACLFER